MLSQLPCLGVSAARDALALIGRRPLGWIGSEVLRDFNCLRLTLTSA
jgi:hypothetical protein